MTTAVMMTAVLFFSVVVVLAVSIIVPAARGTWRSGSGPGLGPGVVMSASESASRFRSVVLVPVVATSAAGVGAAMGPGGGGGLKAEFSYSRTGILGISWGWAGGTETSLVSGRGPRRVRVSAVAATEIRIAIALTTIWRVNRREYFPPLG